jgi:hypothetical protein
MKQSTKKKFNVKRYIRSKVICTEMKLKLCRNFFQNCRKTFNLTYFSSYKRFDLVLIGYISQNLTNCSSLEVNYNIWPCSSKLVKSVFG